MYATSQEQRRRGAKALAEKLYRTRRTYLLRIAVQNGVGDADAEEAVQEAFLAFVGHFDPECGAPPLAWLTLTLKRECWARQRKARGRSLFQEAGMGSAESGHSLDTIPSCATGPGQRVTGTDEARRRLAELKPAERRAIGLVAAGYSYREVGQITGWTKTKINRCLSEGRARLRG